MWYNPSSKRRKLALWDSVRVTILDKRHDHREHTNRGGDDRVLTLKEINAIFGKLREILAVLDKIYHALEKKE